MLGLRTIAAPVFDRSNRVVAAINVAGAVAVVGMKDMIRNYLPVLLDATHGLSRALGSSVTARIPPRSTRGRPPSRGGR